MSETRDVFGAGLRVGFTLAAVNLARDHGEDVTARALLDGAGYTLAMIEADGHDDDDLTLIRAMFSDTPPAPQEAYRLDGIERRVMLQLAGGRPSNDH
jgi:hypothetical protein